MRVTAPNHISIGSVVFARLTVVTNRPTDRQTDRSRYYIYSNRLAVFVMRHSNGMDSGTSLAAGASL